MPDYARIAKVGFLWSVLARLGSEAIGILAAAVLARLLTPKDFGVAAAAAVFLQVATKLTNFGFNTALVQAKKLEEAHKSSVFVVGLVAGAVVSLCLTAASPAIAGYFDSPELRLVLPLASTAFVINAFGAVPGALLSRDMRFQRAVSTDWIYALTLAGTSIGMAWYGWGYWSLVCSQLAAISAQTIARMALCGWWIGWTVSGRALRDLVSFGLGLHTKRLLDAMASNVDNLVVGRMLGLAPLGLYDKAFSAMSRASNLLVSSGQTVSFRILAVIGDEPERFRTAYTKLVLASSLVAYPLLAWAAAAADDLFPVMFGDQWGGAIMPFRIMCLVAAFRLPIGYASTAIQALGFVWAEVWRQLFYLLAVMVCVYVGCAWGLTGAAWGLLLATVALAALMQVLLCRVTSLSGTDVLKTQVPPTLCAAVVGVFVTVVRLSLPFDASASAHFLFLLVDLAVAAAAALGFLLLAPLPTMRLVVGEILHQFSPNVARFLTPSYRP